DRLQPNRIGTGGEPVGQLGEPDARLEGLPLCPLVVGAPDPPRRAARGTRAPVAPDILRIRELGAHLDNRRSEIVVPEVKVITGAPPVGFGEREPDRLTAALLGRGEHRRELLRNPDRAPPSPAGRRLPRQIWPHPIDLAVVPPEPHHPNPVVLGETRPRPAERETDVLHYI